MARRYLGYGVTNNNGVATLDHAPDGTTLSHSYTGVGAGKIDVVAESGSLQSEPKSILDCVFEDVGTYTATKWSNYSNRLTVESDSTGVELTSPESNDGFFICNPSQASNPTNTQLTVFNAPVCIEFDFVSWTEANNTSIFFNDGTSKDIPLKNKISEGKHFKMTVDGTKYNVWSDDTQTVTNGTLTLTNTFRMGLKVQSGENKLKFKNFKVYPI